MGLFLGCHEHASMLPCIECRAKGAEALIVQAAGLLALLVDGHVCEQDAATEGDPLCEAERVAAVWLKQPSVRRLVEEA